LKIDIFTDGACSGNPGKGGYGILMRVVENNFEKKFSQGFRKTTNNRMELLAVIVALENMKSNGHEIHIYTDSKYVADAINEKWIFGWVKKGFAKVKNPDLWKRFYALYKTHQPHFHWIKGHNGHPENEICDQLAVVASQKENLEIDTYYENPTPEGLF
jgi:ribonuclease HI